MDSIETDGGTLTDEDVSAEGFPEFYRREFGAQVRRAALIVGSGETAADVVQDAFVAVWDRWDELDEPRSYLSRCVVNGCRGVHRRQLTRQGALSRLGRPDASLPPHDVMWDAVGALKFNLRAPLVLRYYSQLSNPEIAAVLDWPLGSVGPRITKGLRQLRRAMP